MSNSDIQAAGGREPRDETASGDTRTPKTPNADMQAEDAGTADSGADTDGATSTEGAMKQTSKTDAESVKPR